jgi:signal peptidase I
MATKDKQQSRQDNPPARHKDHAAEVANTLEWLITAFILAFLFRAFVMEAFRIPTGSMADTLMGAHFRLGCPECGYEFNYGFVPQYYQLPEDTAPSGSVPLRPVRCPSCGFIEQSRASDPVRELVYNGDRILVLKCLYQFSPPKRWDVVVFKNPTNPTQNYIKRLIGLPGETIEIVDGDIYVDGRVARKPPMVLEELWMPIYDNDFQPMHPDSALFNGSPWQLPFDLKDSAWKVDRSNDPTRLHLDCPPDEPCVLTYGGPSANDFRARYAYNDLNMGNMPVCSDLMVRLYADFAGNPAAGQVGVVLTRYGVPYQGSVDSQGKMEVSEVSNTGKIVLATATSNEIHPGKPLLVKFAHVDHQLVLQVGRQILVHDLDGSRSAAATRSGPKPEAQILGAGQLTVSHLAIFRDIYYTSLTPYSRGPSHATENHPFKLQPDEFFVLGDNSPNSEDARWWPTPTTASKGQKMPRAGTVPRDYLMGKALFVYWPGGFAFPWPKPVRAFSETPDQPGPLRTLQEIIKFRWIPNVGRMRFIYGGSDPVAPPAMQAQQG